MFDGQLDLDLAKLVFMEETGLSTTMDRLRGRSMRKALLRGDEKTRTDTDPLLADPSSTTAPPGLGPDQEVQLSSAAMHFHRFPTMRFDAAVD
ncbi:MAG: hypothetical protein E5Y65_07765 [Mesorhizobium sp.]|uniref:hypothetical protein n=1 Tax=Mesorhizobium muleiense TaxID=1004279 RepID=UPI000FD3D857|nr:hypothetical protein EOA88_19410 [Mesorhizobium sp. M5C.F.Ca.IN.020.14.1.1]RWE99203.1 MAG: hypothetical protein EOS43_16090 [Mesorhizobium sp.]RWL14757.1 MAG: hypothetical protein EOR57_31870 [Mesorhizobium sp.]TIL92985.1 MAG: hypothetical protein E5Y65_07765 [Mesorhizobium sp.]TIM01294.1 MAG: hypothetical protein E5Y64_10485 [Mesorhizobium sp.]